MTRKKESAQPMLALKGEFQDSLDNLCQAAMNLMFAVETAFPNRFRRELLVEAWNRRVNITLPGGSDGVS